MVKKSIKNDRKESKKICYNVSQEFLGKITKKGSKKRVKKIILTRGRVKTDKWRVKSDPLSLPARLRFENGAYLFF